MVTDDELLQVHYSAHLALVREMIEEHGKQRIVCMPPNATVQMINLPSIHDLFEDDYREDDDTPERPPAPESTALDELNAYFAHYGFEALSTNWDWQDIAAHIVALLGHIETTITAPSQTRGAQSPHPLYPEDHK